MRGSAEQLQFRQLLQLGGLGCSDSQLPSAEGRLGRILGPGDSHQAPPDRTWELNLGLESEHI